MAKKARDMKLFKLSCKDIGSEDCGFSVTTHSAEEVKKAMFAHANYAHPEKLKGVTEEQKQAMSNKMSELLSR